MRVLKWLGILFGAFVALLIVVAIVSPSNKSVATPTAVVVASAASSAPTAVTQVATSVPSPQPTTVPIVTKAPPIATAAPTLAKVGQRVESGGIALTVNAKNTATDSGNQFIKPKDGNLYLIADVTIENTSRDKSPYNPFYFKVKDGDGYEYSVAMSLDEKTLKSGDLAAGEKARGTVTFEVPKAAKGFVMSYQPAVIFGGYQVIRVQLE